jgi:hypothetical protein
MVLPVGSKTDRLVTNKTNPGIEPTTISTLTPTMSLAVLLPPFGGLPTRR